jgi:predicted TIM-barrel fold metal-dependent hydrolase
MFDANAHPTVDGTWIDGRKICGFAESEARLRATGFQHACAVALPGVGGYSPTAFAEAARGDFWIPVAAWELSDFDSTDWHSTMCAFRALGYRGVKLHPRLLGKLPNAATLARLIVAAHESDLRLVLCTYPFGAPCTGLRGNLLEVLSEAMEAVPDARLLLLHAGCVDFMRFVEFARINRNILLDLSFTILKYEGSSLDADLRFAFRTFDQRLCIGSDYPEYDPASLRRRFERLALEAQIDDQKRAAISTTNAQRFFGLGI